MSVKQRLPSLSLLYSIYEDDPEQTLDEAEVDSYFHCKQRARSTLNRLRHFLKQYDHAQKATLYPLKKPLQEIGFTLWKAELFSHYYLILKKHTDRHLLLSSRFEKDKNCCFSLKKFLYGGNQFVMTDIVNLSHNELYELYKDRYFTSTKSGIIESNYDVNWNSTLL